ncbi:MAG: right-handed parallel beta-helix repeat-containing protein [Acidobacteriota bacterium]
MKPATLVPRLGLCLLLAAPAAAVTIHVDPTLGVDECRTYDPSTRSCSGGSELAVSSLAPFVDPSRTAPGDLVLLRGGTYTETLNPGGSGTEAEPIVYASYPGEQALFTGSLDPAIFLFQLEHVTIRDLAVDDVTAWVRAEECSRLVIRDCTFTDANARGSRASVKLVDSHHCQVIDNILDDGNDNLQLIHSDHNLVEGNRITLARHNLWSILCGNFNVIRNNYFHNAIQKAGQITDCEGVPSDATPSFDDTHRNLIEGNEFAFTGNSGDASPYAGIQHAGQETLIRRNVFHHTIGPGLDLTLYDDEARINTDNRIAHNVFVASDFAGVSIARGTTLTGNIFKNNVLSGSRFVANDTRWRWYTEVLHGEPVQLLTARLDGFVLERNLFWGGAPDVVHVIAEGHRTDDPNPPPRTLDQWVLTDPTIFVDNLEADPLFVDPESDWRPAGGSPLVDAGAFLTRTVNGGFGSTMTVEDARWFHDGLDVPGVEGDLIQLAFSTSETARVTRIDLEAGVLFLDRSLIWGRGEDVSLAYEGDAPDIGVHEATDCPPPVAPTLTFDAATDAWVFDVPFPTDGWTWDLRGGELNWLVNDARIVLECLADDLTEPRVDAASLPANPESLVYLVVAQACGEDSGLGTDSSGMPRIDGGDPCP